MKVPEKKVWPLIPEDVYQVQITDLTAEVSEFKGEKKDVFKFEFTIIEDGAYYGRKLWKKGVQTVPIPYASGKNPLTWKVASAVAKHPLTEEEGKAYTAAAMNAMIGKQIRINVTVTAPKDDGKQFNNVESILSAKQELPAFDESKVKKDEPATPATPAKPTPAQIVEQASGGKFAPHTHPQDVTEAVEVGEVDPEEVPF
jgi:hypothetical protein